MNVTVPVGYDGATTPLNRTVRVGVWLTVVVSVVVEK